MQNSSVRRRAPGLGGAAPPDGPSVGTGGWRGATITWPPQVQMEQSPKTKYMGDFYFQCPTNPSESENELHHGETKLLSGGQEAPSGATSWEEQNQLSLTSYLGYKLIITHKTRCHPQLGT